MEKSEAHKATFEHAKKLREPHETEIRDAYKFSYPSRAFDKQPGEKIDRSKIYDDTATHSVRSLVTNVIKLLVPQNRQWARITLKTAKLKEQLETALAERVMGWNDALNNHFLTSNFYLKMDEAMNDAVVAGTACIAFYDRVGEPLTYISVPVDQLYFTQDHNGNVDAVFREHELTGRQMIGRFGKKLQSELKQTCTDAPDKLHKIVECVVPAKQGYDYIVYSKADWSEIESSVTRWNPFIVWRWEKSLNEAWGNSPVRDALPSIRSLNMMARDTLEAGNFSAKPCYQITGDILNIEQLKTQLVPGGLIATEAPLQPLATGANFPITLELIEKTRASVRSLLYGNQIMNRDISKTPMSATEASLRQTEFYAQIGQPALRLQKELLQPIAEQAVQRLMERGDLEALPNQLVAALNIPGAKTQADIFKVETNAAIERAIKMSEAQNDLQTLVTMMQSLGDPNLVLTHVDVDELIRNTLEGFSFSPDAIRSREEVKQMKEQMQQIELQQQALGLAAQQAKAQGGMR